MYQREDLGEITGSISDVIATIGMADAYVAQVSTGSSTAASELAAVWNMVASKAETAAQDPTAQPQAASSLGAIASEAGDAARNATSMDYASLAAQQNRLRALGNDAFAAQNYYSSVTPEQSANAAALVQIRQTQDAQALADAKKDAATSQGIFDYASLGVLGLLIDKLAPNYSPAGALAPTDASQVQQNWIDTAGVIRSSALTPQDRSAVEDTQRKALLATGHFVAEENAKGSSLGPPPSNSPCGPLVPKQICDWITWLQDHKWWILGGAGAIFALETGLLVQPVRLARAARSNPRKRRSRSRSRSR